MAELKGTQCRNVVYCKNPKHLDYDLHLVKVTDYYTDGTKEPKVKLVKDFNKTFWVANRKNRHYKQKKERFPLTECDEIKAPRRRMAEEAARALDIKFLPPNPNEILKDPYVFGTDLTSSAELKFKYNQSKYARETEELADVAAFDVETNIRDKKRWQWIEMATLSFKDVVITVVDKYFIQEKYPSKTKEQILEDLYKYDNIYLKEINEERKIKQEFYVVDSEIEVLTTLFKRAHELKPDFISAWNMDFDISRLIEACSRANMDPADLLSDPTVPRDFRFFRYNPGRESGMSQKGVWKTFANYEKWPQVFCPSSFVFADSMCFYYGSRKHKGKLPKYSLDYILSREFPDEIKPGMSEKDIEKRKKNSRIRKLKFEESNHLAGTPDWHIFMQSKYPYEYVIYNKFDCVALEYLDEQTLDLCHTLVSSCEYSDYKDFESEPKRLANHMHWFNLGHGYAYGTGGQNCVIPLDSKLIGRDDWIITLRADLLVESGMNNLIDAPLLHTNVHQDSGDIDVTSSYPYSNLTMNTSVETMTKELISIEEVDEIDRRQAGINFSGGFINSVENACKLFHASSMADVLKAYRTQRQN